MTIGAVLEKVVGSAAARSGWPGCSAVVVRNGEPDVFRSWGSADATGRGVDEQTGFRIGSTGKTLTAMALMSLVEQGLVGLDDPVDRHVSARLEVPGPPVLVRHLASHTAGLGDLLRWRDILAPRAGAGVRPGRPRPRIDDLYRNGVPVPVPAGLVWRYANHGITLLGSVVEKATGLDFDAAMDKLVHHPLGMQETGFGRAWLEDPRTARGYSSQKGKLVEVPALDIAVAPAGSTISRATDMARYLQAMLSSGPVGAPVVGQMLQPLHQPDPLQTQTAAVWWVNRLDGHRVLRHGGAWSGFRSVCMIAPDDGIALWFGINCEDDGVEQIGLGLMRELLGARGSAQELADLAAASPGGTPPPAGRYVPVGTALSTLTTWSGRPRGIRVRPSSGVTSLVARGAWSEGFALQHIGRDDPTLFGADLGPADALSHGWTTVQVMGTATQPVLLLNGRSPFARTDDSIRSWLPVEHLEPRTREQLAALCV